MIVTLFALFGVPTLGLCGLIVYGQERNNWFNSLTNLKPTMTNFEAIVQFEEITDYLGNEAVLQALLKAMSDEEITEKLDWLKDEIEMGAFD